MAGGSLGFSLRGWLAAALVAVAAIVSATDNPPKVALETSETLFAVLTAINACGYDAELNISHPLRAEIRGEVAKAVEASAEAGETQKLMCQFYQEHQQPDAARTLAQYVSLALFMGNPPDLVLKEKEANLPPDASYVLGFVPLVQKFYSDVELHAIWEKHQPVYSVLSERYHEPLAKMTFDTEVYLKMPSAGFLGQTFTVYLEPMGDPGQTNAREYGTNYSVVISPAPGSPLKMEQIRHTYLHFLLDPLALKYPMAVGRLEPLLDDVKKAPMEGGFHHDISLLVTECLIRAIEARTIPRTANLDAQQAQLVERAQKQGFVLTPYFYQAMVRFEKDPAGLRNAYSDLLNGIDLHKEQKRAAETQFAAEADPELLHLSRPAPAVVLQKAEESLAAGDADAASKLAQQALDEKSGDPGKALFILARAAAVKRDMQGARGYFEKAISVAQEPKVVAWSHIYLGRICDLQEERAAALDHYRAALTAGANLPEARAAAQRGLDQPYEPPARPQQ